MCILLCCTYIASTYIPTHIDDANYPIIIAKYIEVFPEVGNRILRLQYIGNILQYMQYCNILLPEANIVIYIVYLENGYNIRAIYGSPSLVLGLSYSVTCSIDK